jgi:[ribosomal protein S18]-alanine N-acetyltransferase
VLYRLYKPGDFAALYAIEEVCFEPPHRFSRSYIRQLTRQSDAATWVAEDAEQMRGFGIVEWSHQEAEIIAYVQTLEVLPEARGQGVGAEMLQRMEWSAIAAGAEAIWLHVDAENGAAIRVYERAGYMANGMQDDYYGRGRAALVYGKELLGKRTGFGPKAHSNT